MMQELRRYFSYIGKYKKQYWTVFMITLLSSASLNVIFSYMNKLLFYAVENRNKKMFFYAVFLCVILAVFKCLFPYLRYFQIRIVRNIVFDIKMMLFRKLLKMNMVFYEKNHSGELLKTLNWDANSLKDSYFSHVYWVAGKVFDGSVSIMAMLIYSPLLALISISFSMVTVCISIKINEKIKTKNKMIQVQLSKLAERLSDILSGHMILKMYQGASIVVGNYQKENEEVTRKEKQRVNHLAMLEMVSFLLGILGSFGTMMVGAFLVHCGKSDYGTVMAVVSLQMSVSTMMQKFGSSMATCSMSLVKAGRAFDFLEADGEEEQGERRIEKISMQQIPIEINGVCFSYQRHETVMKRFDMHVATEEKILIMGESGCGKSTLLKLLLRFYDKRVGEIRIWGKEITEYSLEQLRELITYIPQNSYLFEGTIRENIAYGANGRLITEEEIVRVAKLAYADEFIRELPQGYDTQLTMGGTNLSGGQQQRIAIARAFLKNSPILCMDEPTSALDAKSEKMISQAMRCLMEGKVVLMVTHRKNAFDGFHRVVKIGN